MAARERTVAAVDGVGTVVKRTRFVRVTTGPASRRVLSWKDVVEEGSTP